VRCSPLLLQSTLQFSVLHLTTVSSVSKICVNTLVNRVKHVQVISMLHFVGIGDGRIDPAPGISAAAFNLGQIVQGTSQLQFVLDHRELVQTLAGWSVDSTLYRFCSISHALLSREGGWTQFGTVAQLQHNRLLSARLLPPITRCDIGEAVLDS
jgi:hypothetical protein